jgi:hypothetical protein
VNWCVSTLPPEHHAYVLDDIDAPGELLTHIFSTADWAVIQKKLREEYPNYRIFATAGVRVAVSKGAPYHDAGASRIIDEFTRELAEVADQLGQWRDFTDDIRAQIEDANKGLSEAVIEAVSAHAEAHGLTLPRTEKGAVSLSEKAMKLAGLDGVPALLGSLQPRLRPEEEHFPGESVSTSHGGWSYSSRYCVHYGGRSDKLFRAEPSGHAPPLESTGLDCGERWLQTPVARLLCYRITHRSGKCRTSDPRNPQHVEVL